MREPDPNYMLIRQRRPGLAAVFVVSALTSVLVSALTVVALSRWGGPGSLASLLAAAAPAHAAGPEVRVPDVVGMTADNADELLSARKLRFVVKERRGDQKTPAGTVLAQQPLAQSRIQPNGEVSVVLSTGPDRVKVPDVLNKPLTEAQSALEAVGLKAGALLEVESGEPGMVTAVSPQPGTELERGASVSLAVARPKVAVPKLRGEHIRKARELLKKAGLAVGSVRETYDEHMRGNLVLSSEPEPGTAVPLGTEVNLIINQDD
jgi:serine/threonine-protein kinase